MKVQRLNKSALLKLLDGKVEDEATCVIKFYSNTCELCHNFHSQYAEMSTRASRKELHFFAFNIADHPTADYELGFEGVPTLVLLDVSPHRASQITIVPDPEHPHPLTYLTTTHVADFIGNHLRRKNFSDTGGLIDV